MTSNKPLIINNDKYENNNCVGSYTTTAKSMGEFTEVKDKLSVINIDAERERKCERGVVICCVTIAIILFVIRITALIVLMII